MSLKAIVPRTSLFALFALLLGSSVLLLAQKSNQQISPSAPDNIQMSEHDQNADGPSADQQKNDQTDLEITQQIRRAIVDDKSLSISAHNVEIITRNGRVMLKGPVQSEDEKKAVEAKAAEVAGTDKVISELDIKPAS